MNRAEEKNQRRNRIIDAAVFAVLLAAVSAVTLYLFYGQTQWDVDSDMEAYILEMQGLESGYSFPYPVFFKLAALVHLFASPALSVAIAAMLLNGLGMVVTKLAFNYLRCLSWRRGSAGKRPGLFSACWRYPSFSFPCCTRQGAFTCRESSSGMWECSRRILSTMPPIWRPGPLRFWRFYGS